MMKKVYKCEYCDEISMDIEIMKEHEKLCGKNPNNQIDDELILKISRIKNSVEDALIYILLTEYKDKIDFIKEECKRVTTTNCPASIYRNSQSIINIINHASSIEPKEKKWFLDITKRDHYEFIEAIKIHIKEPFSRIGVIKND